ncbi:MAG: hypothetical protein R2729_05290 [Bryobacteraceae bacterium]
MTRTALWSAGVAILAIGIGACTPAGPPPPRTGTPAYYWLSAMETWQAGQYEKCLEHLEKILRGGDPIVAKAAPLRLLILAGLARGYEDMSDQFQLGAESIKSGSTASHRRRADQYRAQAANFALQLGDAYAQFEQASPSGPVTFDFPFPTRGVLVPPAVFTRVGQGQLIPDMEIDRLLAAMLQRGVLREVTAAVGAAGDTAKAQAAMAKLPLEAGRGPFLAALGESLYEVSKIFGPRGRGETPRQEHLLNLASKALAGASGDSLKELKAKVEKDLKSAAARKK